MSWAQVLSAAGYQRDGGLLHVPTSGTTGGQPRVVVRTVESWSESFAAFTDATGVHADDVVLAAGPPTSMFVYARTHAAALGARCIAEPRWRAALAASATVVHLTPTMLAQVLELEDLRDLRLAIVAGAALPSALREQAHARGIQVIEYYGAAELSFVALGRGLLRAFPGVEIEARADVLWVRSPWTALGYVDGQHGPLRRDGDWCTVGDRGSIDDGVVRVHGRDGLILTGGISVMAADVEAVIRDAPGVNNVVVLGIPHADLGEIVAAVVVGGERSAVVQHAATHLPREQRPVRWFTADALPMANSGKVSVADLRIAIAAGEVQRWT